MIAGLTRYKWTMIQINRTIKFYNFKSCEYLKTFTDHIVKVELVSWGKDNVIKI